MAFVRKCEKCGSIDSRESWSSATEAADQGAFEKWTCPSCAWTESTWSRRPRRRRNRRADRVAPQRGLRRLSRRVLSDLDLIDPLRSLPHDLSSALADLAAVARRSRRR